jgi:hypothetical protein
MFNVFILGMTHNYGHYLYAAMQNKLATMGLGQLGENLNAANYKTNAFYMHIGNDLENELEWTDPGYGPAIVAKQLLNKRSHAFYGLVGVSIHRLAYIT